VPLFTSGGLGLVSSKQRSWFWSCYLGLGLGLKKLVLFTSLWAMHAMEGLRALDP